MTDKNEVLELAKKCGAVQVYPGEDVAHTFSFAQLLAFASALREQYAGQVAMLYNANRTYKNAVAYAKQYAHLPDAQEEIATAMHIAEAEWEMALSATQQDTDAFIAGVKAGALAAWRAQALDALRGAIADGQRAHGELDLVLVWYDTLDGWATLDGRESILWRPQCSVVADAVTLGARLVQFDPVKYAKWLGKRKDSEPLRGQWAAETAGA